MCLRTHGGAGQPRPVGWSPHRRGGALVPVVRAACGRRRATPGAAGGTTRMGCRAHLKRTRAGDCLGPRRGTEGPASPEGIKDGGWVYKKIHVKKNLPKTKGKTHQKHYVRDIRQRGLSARTELRCTTYRCDVFTPKTLQKQMLGNGTSQKQVVYNNAMRHKEHLQTVLQTGTSDGAPSRGAPAHSSTCCPADATGTHTFQSIAQQHIRHASL